MLTQMQESVHVGVGESGHELRGVLGFELHLLVSRLRIKFVDALIVHQLLHLCLNLLQMQETWLIFSISLLFFLGWFSFSFGGATTFAFLIFTLLLFALCRGSSFRFFFLSSLALGTSFLLWCITAGRAGCPRSANCISKLSYERVPCSGVGVRVCVRATVQAAEGISIFLARLLTSQPHIIVELPFDLVDFLIGDHPVFGLSF